MKTRFPLAYWGSISYYQKLCSAANPVVELDETYRKQSCRNRCSILSASGVQDLSIPVVKPQGSKSKTSEIVLADSEDWRTLHWRAIKTAYASAPYFEHYSSEIHELLYRNDKELVPYVWGIHERICQWLDLAVQVTLSTDFQVDYQTDYLTAFKTREQEQDYFYQQVFSDRSNFQADLSLLDALMNLGPMARLLVVPAK